MNDQNAIRIMKEFMSSDWDSAKCKEADQALTYLLSRFEELTRQEGILKADEVTLEFFRTCLKMPNATLEDLCREIVRLKTVPEELPEKNQLPLELQNCYMEIYRKEQNLTPLLNEVRNEIIDLCTPIVNGLKADLSEARKEIERLKGKGGQG